MEYEIQYRDNTDKERILQECISQGKRLIKECNHLEGNYLIFTDESINPSLGIKTNKDTIVSDGCDIAEIHVKVSDDSYSDTVMIFVNDNSREEVQCVNGLATYLLTANNPGVYKIVSEHSIFGKNHLLIRAI